MERSGTPALANEIKLALEGNDVVAKIDAMKNAIKLLLNGETPPTLFITIVRYVLPSEDHKIQKLLLLYLEIIDLTDSTSRLLPEMILICQYLRNNLQHPKEYIRGVTLRFLSRLSEAEIIKPLIPSILSNIEHPHPFTRRNAILAVTSIYKLPQGEQLLAYAPKVIERMLNGEQDPSARRNAFLMLFTFAQERAVNYLLSHVDQVQDWPDQLQMVVLDLIRLVCRSNRAEKDSATRGKMGRSSTLPVHFDKGTPALANEIKLALEGNDVVAKIDAMENAIKLLLNGETLPTLFITIVRYILPSEDHTIQKLLPLYLKIIDLIDSTGRVLPQMILICQFLRNNLQHPNEYIQGVTLQFLSRLSETEIIEPLIPLKSRKGMSQLELEDEVQDDLKHTTGEFTMDSDDANKLNSILQLTGFSDPIYAEAYVTVHHYDIVLDVTVINRTKDILQNLCLELATMGDLKLVERPQNYTLAPESSKQFRANIKVSSMKTGVIFGNIVYETSNMLEKTIVVLNDIHIDIMDYISPATCTDVAFRNMWAEFEWENKVTVFTVLQDEKQFLKHIIKSTNMKCLTAPSALVGECDFLAANLYGKSIFGEDALVNISIEKQVDGKLSGHIKIRSKTQRIALSLGDKITLKQKGGRIIR